MFERKNQNILSEHYQKLVDHGAASGDDDDEFITLKRADHDLDDLPGSDDDGPLGSGPHSKRKQRLALSKKALAKHGEKGHKLVFDAEGRAHEVYEMRDAAEVFGDDARAVFEAGRQFAEAERGRLREADVVDKAEAKEKKREKKRRRKEREREVRVCLSPDSGSLLAVWDGGLTGVMLGDRARGTMAGTTMGTPRWVRRLRNSRRTMDTSPPSSIFLRRRTRRRARTSGRRRRRHARPPCLRCRKRRSWRCRCCAADVSARCSVLCGPVSSCRKSCIELHPDFRAYAPSLHFASLPVQQIRIAFMRGRIALVNSVRCRLRVQELARPCRSIFKDDRPDLPR